MKKVSDNRVGGGSTNIGEDDGWDTKWPDGDGRADIRPSV